MKVLPIYTIKDTKLNCNDIRMTFLLYFFYLLWLRIRNKDLFYFQIDLMRSFIHDKNRNPPTEIISSLMQ